MGLLGNIATSLPFVGGIVQSAIDARNAKRNTEMTINANKELAKYQYSKDLEMWNKANEYNSPSAQMARYTSAGLNPNLIYGSGSASAGNTATTLPKYNAPTAEYNYKPAVNIANALGMYQDFAVRQAQIDNLREQNRNIKLQGDLLYYKKALWEPWQGDMTSIAATTAKYQMDAVRLKNDLAIKQIDSVLLGNALKKLDINWYPWNRAGVAAVKAAGNMLKVGSLKLGGRVGKNELAGAPKQIARSVTKYYR